jgi:formate-nitrite transporter family protein
MKLEDRLKQETPGPAALSENEREEVDRRTAPRAVIVHEAIAEEGQTELQRPVSSLAWSGLAAGLSMGFSILAMGALHAALPEGSWREVVSKLGYTIGFVIVVLGRQQLFTENTLTVILPLLKRRDATTLAAVLRLWTVVLVTNLLGIFVFAWTAAGTEVLNAETRASLDQLAAAALLPGNGTLLIQAVFAGWLIAMMVWLLPAAETARPQIIIIMTYLVALGDFAHVIVGSGEVLYLVARGLAGWGEYLRFLGLTLLGNTLGGVTLVAMLNHAQVKAEAHAR